VTCRCIVWTKWSSLSYSFVSKFGATLDGFLSSRFYFVNTCFFQMKTAVSWMFLKLSNKSSKHAINFAFLLNNTHIHLVRSFCSTKFSDNVLFSTLKRNARSVSWFSQSTCFSSRKSSPKLHLLLLHLHHFENIPWWKIVFLQPVICNRSKYYFDRICHTQVSILFI